MEEIGAIIFEEDRDTLQETLYLLSIPGMGESIVSGMKEPIESCSESLEW
jgi:antitoxin YefM